MTKDEMIDYLNVAVKYINLLAVCDLYNELKDDKLDYNNLRITIKKQSSTRLSKEKLEKFILFLKGDFMSIAFGKENSSKLRLGELNNKIEDEIDKFACQLKEEIKNELFRK